MPATAIAGAPRRRLGGAAEEPARALLGRAFDLHCPPAHIPVELR